MPAPVARHEFPPLLDQLHRTLSLARARLADVLAEFGLTLATFDTLRALHHAGPPYQLAISRLAVCGSLSASSMTRRADRLEERGLIVREPGLEDRRAVSVRLTVAGRQLLDEVLDRYAEEEQHLLAPMPDSERQMLTVLLGRVEDSISSSSPRHWACPMEEPPTICSQADGAGS
ncbi:MarR family winged helix-turn-helix transcriptional regulator [Streptomyces sp. NPDC057565]|uniref:MarR family winged helix-turn-helix transcriptional regulator n=1 Tax=Streptomyces sp. NPDC057565 TaxID=3346169 RepID=UPI0036955A7B